MARGIGTAPLAPAEPGPIAKRPRKRLERRACCPRVKLVALLLVSALLAGCSFSSGSAVGDASVAPEKFKEINLGLKAGKTVTWDWSTTGGAARFDVHSHKDGVVTEHVIRAGTSDKGSFTAPADGEYSLLWENKGTATIHVAYNVHVDGKITSQFPK